MPIPPGTKFHGVAPGVETENKGSSTKNSLRNAYAIEEFGSSPFQFNADIPASGTLTFTGLPSDGDTITVGGTVITFRTVLTGSGDEIKIEPSVSNQTLRVEQYFNNSTQFLNLYNVATKIPVVAERPNNETIKITYLEGGAVGNTVATTSSGANFSWGAATLEGGADNTSAVTSDGGNIYMKCVAIEAISHGNICYLAGWDSSTGLPLVIDNSYSTKGLSYKRGSGALVPFGIAFDAEANGSFNTIKPGEVFNVCLFGIVGQVYVYVDTTTGLRPNPGETLSLTGTKLALSPNNGDGQPLATMLYPGTNSTFVPDAIVFFHGGLSSPFTRPTIDGAYSENTTRVSGISTTGVTAGCLVVHSGNTSPSPITRYLVNYRHYTGTDANLDIVGIATRTESGSQDSEIIGVCINGLVSNVTLYDAAGAVIPTTTTTIYGDVVYAGDGTINPSHVLTTDPTSGVAVGIVSTDSPRGALQPNTWTILFQPYRL